MEAPPIDCVNFFGGIKCALHGERDGDGDKVQRGEKNLPLLLSSHR